MARTVFIIFLMLVFQDLLAQDGNYTLSHYICVAQTNSPLIKDYHNRIAIQQEEPERLKALHLHARLEMNGDLLFVPIVSRDGGKTSFKWNTHDAIDYYGYDLGESSGHLHAGVTWTQPLLGRNTYNLAKEQIKINTDIANYQMRLEAHHLQRAVTEQYLLCLLDKTQSDFADTVSTLLSTQKRIIEKMVENGLSKQSDLHLLAIEQAANEELRNSFEQSYHSHLIDLNILCGITDTTNVALSNMSLDYSLPLVTGQSFFTEQYRLDSLSAIASLHNFNVQYQPRLDLFVNGGIQVGPFQNIYRHIGWSAGITFSWLLSDGKQRQNKEKQTQKQLNTIHTYRNNANLQRNLRLKECLSELQKYNESVAMLKKQLAEYNKVLNYYSKEMKAGQVSVLDYITVLRNKIQTNKDLFVALSNKQLVVAAYNYWNY